MRRKSLDELPQLFNVLLGNMSLVGAAPRLLCAGELSDLWRRHQPVRARAPPVSPACGRSAAAATPPSRKRISYDEWYIKNWTVWYDLVILLQTVWVLLRGGWARTSAPLARRFLMLPLLGYRRN